MTRTRHIAIGLVVCAGLAGLWWGHAGFALAPGDRLASRDPRVPVIRASLAPGGKPSPALRPPALERRGPAAAASVVPSATGPGPHILHYRGKSGRLEAGVGAMSSPAPTIIESIERQPVLQVWLPSPRVPVTGTTIHARLLVDAADVSLSAPPEIQIAAAEEWPTGVYTRMAAAPGKSPVAGGVEYTERFIPPVARRSVDGRVPAPRPFRYQVVLRGQIRGEPFERRAGGLFYVHAPGAKLELSRVDVAPSGGDLAVRLGVDVSRAGTYFVYAELWGSDGKDGQGDRPIAFARDRLSSLEVGQRSVELRFGGRILRDAGIAGPYIIRNLRIAQVDTHPAQEGEPIAALPATPAWRPNAFY